MTVLSARHSRERVERHSGLQQNGAARFKTTAGETGLSLKDSQARRPIPAKGEGVMLTTKPTESELAIAFGKRSVSSIRHAPTEKRTAHGIVFRSIPEMQHYSGLLQLQRRGLISALQYEPKFHFVVDGLTVGSYKPDFTFIENGKLRCQDCKPWKRNKAGILKPYLRRGFTRTRKLMTACFGIEVEIV